MVNAAVAKGRELGVSENVAILDDGGNLKTFSRMDGTQSPPSRLRRIRRTQLCSAFPRGTFSTLSRATPSLLAGLPTLGRVPAWGGGFPIKVDGEIVEAIGLSGAPTVQNDVDCARTALALVPDAAPVEG
jgi:uncharacterized protein GlcG (DUF336 family)